MELKGKVIINAADVKVSGDYVLSCLRDEIGVSDYAVVKDGKLYDGPGPYDSIVSIDPEIIEALEAINKLAYLMPRIISRKGKTPAYKTPKGYQCSHCNHVSLENTKFCPMCGKELIYPKCLHQNVSHQWNTSTTEGIGGQYLIATCDTCGEEIVRIGHAELVRSGMPVEEYYKKLVSKAITRRLDEC